VEFPKPQQEHQWLQRLVGNWNFEHECAAAPDQPKEKVRGTERIRSLGGLWTIHEGEGDMPGGAGKANTLMTIGYDPQRKTFVGTFIASMMTHLWIYDSGSLDPTGRILTLNAEGPNFNEPGKTAKYQDIIEFVNDDLRIFRSQALRDDGRWEQFMHAEYRRQR
jgi:hypothetical protein